MEQIRVTPGFDHAERDQLAQMYWQAFGPKLGLAMKPAQKAVAFFRDGLDPDYALAGRRADGVLLGVAGFKTAEGALVGGDFGTLRRHYGLIGALRPAILLSLLERSVAPGVLLMDGIFVTREARGQGVGTALLHAIRDEARRRGLSQVRLDVIDTNPRAKALYLRFGFEPVGEEHLGPLRHFFGFRTATQMVLTIPPA